MNITQQAGQSSMLFRRQEAEGEKPGDQKPGVQ